MGFSSKFILGAFLLAVAVVMPAYSLDIFEGPTCRFVNTTSGAVINDTGCPFSDMEPSIFICESNDDEADNGDDEADNGDDEDDNGDDSFRSFFGSMFGKMGRPGNSKNVPDWLLDMMGRSKPVVRQDKCVLNPNLTKSCSSSADCLNVTGVCTSRCMWGTCVPKYISSAAMAAIAAHPCRMSKQGEKAIFEDLVGCKRTKSIIDQLTPSFMRRKNNKPMMMMCEQSPSVTVKLNNVVYEINTCVPAPKDKDMENK